MSGLVTWIMAAQILWDYPTSTAVARVYLTRGSGLSDRGNEVWPSQDAGCERVNGTVRVMTDKVLQRVSVLIPGKYFNVCQYFYRSKYFNMCQYVYRGRYLNQWPVTKTSGQHLIKGRSCFGIVNMIDM
ncbi:hypothetical protein Btru_043055 [Bulinus truncatus]|nr:hypothetical protein Btru_043055 [Bulinus truncatus]